MYSKISRYTVVPGQSAILTCISPAVTLQQCTAGISYPPLAVDVKSIRQGLAEGLSYVYLSLAKVTLITQFFNKNFLLVLMS